MENNDDKIKEYVKLNIAISEFGRRYKMKNKNRVYLKKVAIIILALVTIPIGYVQAQKNILQFPNREPTYILNSISEAITDGYVETLNMEYIYSDGVGLKIDSLMVSDNDINLVFNFKINDEINLNEKNLKFGYLLYNENNEVYYVERDTNINFLKDFMKKNKLKNESNIENHLLASQSTYITNTNENVIVSSLIYAKDYFPKAKKLYIDVVGIGYDNEWNKYKKLSNSRWLIELDIPEKFYESEPKKYELKEPIEDLKLEEFFISDTSSTCIAVIDGINKSGYSISVIDGYGNEYKANERSFSGLNGDKVTCRFPIRKTDITDKMYLKIIINENEEILELVEK